MRKSFLLNILVLVKKLLALIPKLDLGFKGCTLAITKYRLNVFLIRASVFGLIGTKETE